MHFLHLLDLFGPSLSDIVPAPNKRFGLSSISDTVQISRDVWMSCLKFTFHYVVTMSANIRTATLHFGSHNWKKIDLLKVHCYAFCLQ